jgi:hypothetical protein
MAATHSPTSSLDGSPIVTLQSFGVDLDQRHVGAPVDSITLALNSLVHQLDRGLVHVRHQVRVGEDIAILAEDEADRGCGPGTRADRAA